MRRVGVTGGRDYSGEDSVIAAMRRLWAEDPETVIVEGEATGADTLCRIVAKTLGMTVDPFPVTDSEWNKYGYGAGPKRNQRMVDSGLDLLIAFPGGRGTADMVRRARAAGVPVEEVSK